MTKSREERLRQLPRTWSVRAEKPHGKSEPFVAWADVEAVLREAASDDDSNSSPSRR